MTLAEFEAMIKPIPVQDMLTLFARFDLDNLDDTIARARAEQAAAQQTAESAIQALMAQREALRQQVLGL